MKTLWGVSKISLPDLFPQLPNKINDISDVEVLCQASIDDSWPCEPKIGFNAVIV